jgi:hypothetical protein
MYPPLHLIGSRLFFFPHAWPDRFPVCCLSEGGGRGCGGGLEREQMPMIPSHRDALALSPTGSAVNVPSPLTMPGYDSTMTHCADRNGVVGRNRGMESLETNSF